MKKLNIYIDGSWLYKVASPGAVWASKMENSERAVRIDFEKLNRVLLDHVQGFDSACTEFGKSFLSTSVFTLPEDFESWPDDHDNLLPDHIEKTKRVVGSRNLFVESALRAGYSEDAIYRPHIKGWIVESLVNGRYQEKQVDTTVVALLVREAIVNPDDYHCVITGDSDILPAIGVCILRFMDR